MTRAEKILVVVITAAGLGYAAWFLSVLWRFGQL